MKSQFILSRRNLSIKSNFFNKINVEKILKNKFGFKKKMWIWKSKCWFDQINLDWSFLASMVYIYLWQVFRLICIGFVTDLCVNVAFLFEATLPHFRKKPAKAFNALPDFVSANVVNFQFSNFTNNATSSMTLSVSTITITVL